MLLAVMKELPSEMMGFYVKAFQSYCFNKIVQWRIKKFGARVFKGDLVDDKVKGICEVQDESKYSIFDVVLPLPG
jgi:tRNA(Glu) U13 pseudouridine synthase TruD